MVDESAAKVRVSEGTERAAIDWFHEVESQVAADSPLHEILRRIVDFAAALVSCDSCFVYVLERDELVLRASKNPRNHAVNRLKLRVGEGITGWVAEHLQPVALAHDAFRDARFRFFNELPEDRYEAFLSVPILCRGKAVGVINLQHREPHNYSRRQIQFISTLGLLVGAAIKIAQLEERNYQLSQELENRKVLERAKGIVQRELGLSEEEAYITLQKRSRRLRKPLREVAEAVIFDAKTKAGAESARSANASGSSTENDSLAINPKQ
jgi:signal transduction protein with GAF and PtsI domain